MTSLDSNRWSELYHAYGTAEDTPALLNEIIGDPHADSERTKDIWFRLWSSLCHQGDIYSASIAAVPHLIRAALDVSSQPMASGLIELPVAIEESRMDRPHQISSDQMDSDYLHAVLLLEDVCVLAEQWQSDHRLGLAVKAARTFLVGRHGASLPQQKSGDDLGELFAQSSPPTEQVVADQRIARRE